MKILLHRNFILEKWAPILEASFKTGNPNMPWAPPNLLGKMCVLFWEALTNQESFPFVSSSCTPKVPRCHLKMMMIFFSHKKVHAKHTIWGLQPSSAREVIGQKSETVVGQGDDLSCSFTAVKTESTSRSSQKAQNPESEGVGKTTPTLTTQVTKWSFPSDPHLLSCRFFLMFLQKPKKNRVSPYKTPTGQLHISSLSVASRRWKVVSEKIPGSMVAIWFQS